MKPLLVLFSTFLLSGAIIRASTGTFDHAFAARIAMSAMLVFTAMGHVKFRDGMAQMLPAWIPLRAGIVLLTGLIEIAAAVGLQLAPIRNLSAWLLILFFVLILPANINAAMRRLNYETGQLNGPGPRYLWFRIPMQVLLIVWVYISAIRSS